MTFTTEILFFLILGLLVLGPKSMQAMFGHVVRAKAEFDKATRTFKTQVVGELEGRLPPSGPPSAEARRPEA
jgi:Sec-independent protein translocase protein TatA